MVREGGRSQKLMLFIRGNDMSGAPIITGSNKLPKPPIMKGITKKKIMTRAWAVTTTLNRWSSPIQPPATPNSRRMRRLRPEPTMADQRPNSIYKTPISLWLVGRNQRILLD
jgi:hypothetical protein